VVGYLRPVKQWNDGKQAEYRRRRPFNMSVEEAGVTAAVALRDTTVRRPPLDNTANATAATDPEATAEVLRQLPS
jgi:ribonucleoside-triphosphate reductase